MLVVTCAALPLFLARRSAADLASRFANCFSPPLCRCFHRAGKRPGQTNGQTAGPNKWANGRAKQMGKRPGQNKCAKRLAKRMISELARRTEPCNRACPCCRKGYRQSQSVFSLNDVRRMPPFISSLRNSRKRRSRPAGMFLPAAALKGAMSEISTPPFCRLRT